MEGVGCCCFGGQGQHMAWGDTVAFIAPGFVAVLGLSVGEKEPSLRFLGSSIPSGGDVCATTCLCHQLHLQRSPSWHETHGLPGHRCHQLCSVAAPQGWNTFSLPHRGTPLPTRTQQQGACTQIPTQALASVWALRCHPDIPKSFRGGSKHSQGTATLQWGRGHPAALPGHSPFSAGLMLRCRQLPADPRHPVAPRECNQSRGGRRHGPAVTQGPKPAVPVPASPVCFPRSAGAMRRGVSDPVCTAVPAPGPLRGRLENGVARKRVSAPLLAPGRFLPRSTQLPPPRGDAGVWLPPRLLQGQFLPSSLAEGLG